MLGITSKAAEVSTGVLDRVWLAGAPGAEFLSKEEEELCVKIKLLPKYAPLLLLLLYIFIFSFMFLKIQYIFVFILHGLISDIT